MFICRGVSFRKGEDYSSRFNHSYLHDTLKVLYKTINIPFGEDSLELGLISVVLSIWK